jgi:urease subunit gamma
MVLLAPAEAIKAREGRMQLTPREFDKLLIYMVADVALKRKAKGLKLNYPEAVGVISAVALDGARAGKTIEDVTSDARAALTKADVMEGVADLIPMVPTAARSTSCVTRTRLVGSAGSTSATFSTALPIATSTVRAESTQPSHSTNCGDAP